MCPQMRTRGELRTEVEHLLKQISSKKSHLAPAFAAATSADTVSRWETLPSLNDAAPSRRHDRAAAAEDSPAQQSLPWLQFNASSYRNFSSWNSQEEIPNRRGAYNSRRELSSNVRMKSHHQGPQIHAAKFQSTPQNSINGKSARTPHDDHTHAYEDAKTYAAQIKPGLAFMARETILRMPSGSITRTASLFRKSKSSQNADNTHIMQLDRSEACRRHLDKFFEKVCVCVSLSLCAYKYTHVHPC